MIQNDERYIYIPLAYISGINLATCKKCKVYIRKEDIIKAALEIALEDLPKLVQKLHYPEDF